MMSILSWDPWWVKDLEYPADNILSSLKDPHRRFQNPEVLKFYKNRANYLTSGSNPTQFTTQIPTLRKIVTGTKWKQIAAVITESLGRHHPTIRRNTWIP